MELDGDFGHSGQVVLNPVWCDGINTERVGAEQRRPLYFQAS